MSQMQAIMVEELREGDVLLLPFGKEAKVLEVKPWGNKSRFINFKTDTRLGWVRVERFSEVLIQKREHV